MYHNHWSERLSEALQAAETASSGELREIHLLLASHYRGLVKALGSPIPPKVGPISIEGAPPRTSIAP